MMCGDYKEVYLNHVEWGCYSMPRLGFRISNDCSVLIYWELRGLSKMPFSQLATANQSLNAAVLNGGL